CAKTCGASIFSQDSDGNMNPVIDSMLDCGVTCFYPCEPAAGMDIVKLRQKYGARVCFKGGIDKFALTKDFETIRKELAYKMSAPMLGGGTIFAIDHRIPNGVSLENYKYYVNTGREMLGLPPVCNLGWERMAF
ncbi:MAG: uroporphyrinogen decarboxylase family protein, partial [Ruthenibacterium sp.]